MRKKLSVIIPAYNEEAVAEPAAASIGGILKRADIPYELLFVDDGSEDSTWEKISRLSSEDPAIRGIRFSRNFGKDAAIMAGLTAAHGDGCVVIDCDLQHPPEKIIEMYHLWEQGYDIVAGRKSSRGTEGKLHTLAAKTFYSAISTAVGFDMENTSDFKLLDRKAVDVLIRMREKHAFFRALSAWIGFRTAYVDFDVRERMAGTSKWSVRALTRYAINSISSFSTVPMQFATVLGTLMLLISIILGVTALVQACSGHAPEGYTLVIFVQLLSSSLILISLGIIGYYIAKIHEASMDRPRFIIADTCGDSPL